MMRLPLALAGSCFALMATIASAQSYPQPYGMPGSGPMPQAAYGYGPMPPAAMYQGMPGNAMYGGAGYPSGAYSNGVYPAVYNPGMTPQEMYGPGAQNPQALQPVPQQQAAMPTDSSPYPNEYHGPQARIAKASPPPMKLPPGVTAENGLLYYKGSARADVNYQQFPANNSPRGPVGLASYQVGAENESGSAPGMMNPGANAGGGMPGGNAMGYGGTMSSGCNQGCNQCQDNDTCCAACGWLTYPCHCLYGLCHGSEFPGKLGYVWNAGYDSLAMTRNSGTNRPLLLLDNGTTPAPVVFDANQLDFDWDYGGRAHIELIGPSGITYQFQYTRIATFVTQDSVGPIGVGANLTLPGTISGFSGFTDADRASFYYSSAIQTGEFNMIFPFGSFEFLTGYRYMQIDEKAQIATVTGGAGASITADSLNIMNGGQIGALGRWEMFGLIDFDFDAKFAVMGNAAQINQEAIDATGTPVSSPAVISGSKTRIAYVTELGLQGVIPLSAAFSFHAGYNVYFIDGAALAPDQFAFGLGSSSVAGTQVRNHGDLVVQGVNAGVTATW